MNTAPGNLRAALAAAVLLAVTTVNGQELFEVPLENPSFTKGVDDRGVPLGWSKYGGGGKDQELRVVDGPDGGKALLIADGDPAAEIGVSQSFRLKGGETYQVRPRSARWKGPPRRALPAVPVPAFPATGPNGSGRRIRGAVLRGLGQGHGTAGYHARRDLPVHAPRADSARAGRPTSDWWAGSRRRRRPRRRRSRPSTTSSRTRASKIRLVKDGQPNAAIVVPASGIYQTAAAAIQREIENRTRRQGADRLRRRPGSRRAHPRQSHRAGQSLDQQDDQCPVRPVLLPGRSQVPGAGRLCHPVGPQSVRRRAQRRDRRRQRRGGRRRGSQGAGRHPVQGRRGEGRPVDRLDDGHEARQGRETADGHQGVRNLGSLARLRLDRLLRLVQHQQAHGDVLHDGRRIQRPRGRAPVLSRPAGDARTSRRSTASGSRTSTTRWPGSTTTTPTWRSCSGT